MVNEKFIRFTLALSGPFNLVAAHAFPVPVSRLGLWLSGKGAAQGLVLASGDLALGGIWLLRLRRAPR